MHQMQILINMHVLQVPHFFLILSMLIIDHVKTVPHIFNENYEFCEHDLRKPERKQHKKILFTNKLWSIETHDFVLYFSFCKTVQSECFNQTSSCLVRKRDNELIDLGQDFQQSVDDDNIFETVNGAKCPHSDGTYALTITLECSDTTKPTPRLIMPEDDTCNFEVTMMRPDCKPKCTEVVQGAYLIDLRKFPKNINVNTDSRRFSISVCGSSRQCGSADVAACEFLNDNSTVPLAVTTEPQFVTYDITKNELTARGRFKEGRVLREVFILIKCNWQTELSNAKYKVVPQQGKKYKFELESSHGCIKVPQDCFVTSSMIDNLHYNLSNLNNPNGWEIANAPQGRILLNICGSLNNPPNTICSDQYSQVCHIQDNEYINRGSILTSLRPADDDVVKAVFSSGSRCRENATLLYSTQIEFRCSESEKGPTFKEFRGCTMFLLWETPHACPVDLYKGQDCIIHDRVGYRNLKNLFTTTDRSAVPAEGQELIYNICGPIHENCNEFNNVSFCLKVGQDNQVIIGWDKRELISDNGLLRMELTGNKCLNSNSYGKVNINFICNYEELAPPAQINVIEDRCKYNMTVFTSLACFSQNKFHYCNYNVKNVSYDLSPLSYKDRNHVIKSKDGVEYILNICGPIINGPGALCRSDTMICLRNKTEINLKYQYISLGGVSSGVVDNNNLVIRSQIGSYCQGWGHYRTFLHFECSREKLPPTLSSTSPCVYNFTWKTPEACPRNCLIKDVKSDSSFDLNNLNKKILKINLDNGTVLYTFHLCKDIYVKEAKENRNVYYLKRILSVENNTRYLTFDLQQENDNSDCKSASKINKAIFEFRCDASSSTHFEEKNLKNCILNMIIRTSLACSNGKQDFVYNFNPPSHPPPSTEDVESVQATEPLKENKCLLVSEVTGNQLKLTDLKSREIYNGTSKFSLNFDGKLRCDGILCKNAAQLLPMDACPSNTFDYESNQVILHYSTQLVCGHNEYFRLQLQLKCSDTVFEQVILKNTTCELIIAHHLKDVCLLFHEAVKSSKSIVIGSVCGVIIVFIALICIVIYFYRKRFPYNFISDKTSVPIYRRDSTL